MPETISDILNDLQPGAHVTFDSGVPSGSITVTRHRDGDGFFVNGVTHGASGLTAGKAQAEVAQRRQLRDRAKELQSGADIAQAFERYLEERGDYEEATYGDRILPKGTEVGYAAQRAAEITDLFRDIPKAIPYGEREFSPGDDLTPALAPGNAHAVAIYYGLRSPVEAHRKRTLAHVEALQSGQIDMDAELHRVYERAGGSHPTPQYKEREAAAIAAYEQPQV